MKKLQLHYPLKSVFITQGFGGNGHPAYAAMGMGGHNGLDMSADDGTPVYAAHDGRVTFTGYDGSGGLGVVIRTEEEFEYGNGTAYFKTIYWHLKTDSIVVKASQKVKRGELIGLADNTGMSTGSHLHFGLKPIGKGENDWDWSNKEQDNGFFGAIDPIPYFVKFQTPMKYGEQSQNVRDLQDYLATFGLFNVKGTGYYGEITRKAVLEFQLKYVNLSWYEKHIMRGQRVGEKTLSALNDLYTK